MPLSRMRKDLHSTVCFDGPHSCSHGRAPAHMRVLQQSLVSSYPSSCRFFGVILICSDVVCLSSDSSSLARHRRIHTGRRPYKCLVAGCNKSFCRKTTLTKHTRRNHAGVEGTYTGHLGPAVISSNSSNQARYALPPQARPTFPHELSQHYMNQQLKIEDNAYFYSNGPSIDMDRRRLSMAYSGYSTGPTGLESPLSTSSRSHSEMYSANTLTPSTELTGFSRSPDFYTAKQMEATSSAQSNLSNHALTSGLIYHTDPYGNPVADPSHPPMSAPMPSTTSLYHDPSNLHPELWENYGPQTAQPEGSHGFPQYANLSGRFDVAAHQSSPHPARFTSFYARSGYGHSTPQHMNHFAPEPTSFTSS